MAGAYVGLLMNVGDRHIQLLIFTMVDGHVNIRRDVEESSRTECGTS
jgi:hypothetical protein